MDFNFYRNFITVAETGNISKAAQKLSLVQPALSAQLKTIEKYYGIELFKTTRGKRQIELTKAGELFLQQARQLCSAEDNLNLTMQNLKKAATGTLKFAISHMRSEYFLQQYLIPFAQKYPQINYQFNLATAEEQQQQILQGNIDFAFANAPVAVSSDFSAIKIQQEKFFVFCKHSFPLSVTKGETITPSQLDNLPICCNYGSYSLLRSVFQKNNITPQIKFISTSAGDALTFAQSNLSAAVIAALISDPIPKNMQRYLLIDEQLSFQQILYWKNSIRLLPVQQMFLDFIQGTLTKKN